MASADHSDSAPADAPATNASPVRRRRRSVTRRHLHRGHFGFLRAIVQGLNARPMWERYLAEEGEIEAEANALTAAGDGASAFAAHPKVRRVTAWLRAELAAAAVRAERPGTARLVKVDFRQIGRPGLGLPSLEEFAAATGLDGFSEREQLAAYEEKFGAALVREKKRTALMARQLAAIDWLESLYARPVLVDDGCRAWLADTLVDRLEAAGVATVGDLVDRINGLGNGWTRALTGIGAGKARAVERFLAAHAETLTRRVGQHVAVPRRQRYAHELARVVPPATALVPLDKLVVPAELDGRNGIYRRPQAQCLLSAHNDYEAVLAWLRAKPGLPPEQVARLRERRRDVSTAPGPRDWLQTLSHTQRAYRKEAERFLLWAVLVRGKPLSSMAHEDCTAYRDFIGAPPTDWCAPRSRERWSPIWRPFEGPLSLRAQAYALGVLNNLYRFLVDQNYLMGNPWHGVHAPRSATPKLDVGRSLTQAQWEFVQAQLTALPPTSANARLQFALPLLYATGLRLSEAVAATTDHLEWVSLPRPGTAERIEGWWLEVLGKGTKLRRIPVSPAVVDRLGHYLASRGFEADPAKGRLPRGVALLGQAIDVSERAAWARQQTVDPAAGVSANTLAEQLKNFFATCAAALQTTDERASEHLATASTHWLRHTHISHALAAGAPLEVVQQNAGHASLDTTTRYVTTEEARRMAAMQKVWAEFKNA
ncbi:phage integrase family protein [Cupriavidus sp. IK-TO18]|uniref:phage integrase family protein n=1 Tax=Cupriavidus sp. IK-TO18 TaxID=2782182 RepID=UPI0018976294|nr:phage integrase family protein [Cupriavidus sp. IK-TO18]MBF6989414.1 site-specific integrase [Cupriavidus sp. IK-TO18]